MKYLPAASVMAASSSHIFERATFLVVLWLQGHQATPFRYNLACLPENIQAHGRYICDSTGHVICLPGWSERRQRPIADTAISPQAAVAVAGPWQSMLAVHSGQHFDAAAAAADGLLAGVGGKHCTIPTCALECKHGLCIGPNSCECNIGWMGFACDEPVCLPGCQNGDCSEPYECDCGDGWKGMFCNEAHCLNCDHGMCVRPFECIPNPGYQWSNGVGADSHSAKLTVGGEVAEIECTRRPGCQHGSCTLPLECNCDYGWTGQFCSEPACECRGRGVCRPDNVTYCQCFEGWLGHNCEQCAPRADCLHGYCSFPGECRCFDGWSGPVCDAQSVHVDCGQHGTADPVDNTCRCDNDWTGDACETAVCRRCEGRGKCLEPYGVCSDCQDGWMGDFCNEPLCNCQGHGTCSEPLGPCTCSYDAQRADFMYVGDHCEMPKCERECKGYCADPFGSCLCYPGWLGPHCAEPDCSHCNGHGACEGPNGPCQCDQSWYGYTCNRQLTPVLSPERAPDPPERAPERAPDLEPTPQPPAAEAVTDAN